MEIKDLVGGSQTEENYIKSVNRWLERSELNKQIHEKEIAWLDADIKLSLQKKRLLEEEVRLGEAERENFIKNTNEWVDATNAHNNQSTNEPAK
jgi:hypothetical protein